VVNKADSSKAALAGNLPTSCAECRAGALTVAGQWRIRTAFPSILAIVVMKWAVRAWLNNHDVMELVSMTSTFIASGARPSQKELWTLHWFRGVAGQVEQIDAVPDVPRYFHH
jgi:hypothetical protein